jgi:DNA-binding MarR family transcriptional regulator
MAAKTTSIPSEKRRGAARKSASPKAARRISWLDVDRKSRGYNFHEYMQMVAHGRYVFRTVQRLIDNCAKSRGVDPLEHQAMIQIYGASEQRLPMGRLAERLDIDSALASRLVQQLEARQLAHRTRSKEDRRAIYVSLTRDGVKQMRAIVDDVHTEVEFFRLVSDERQRRATHELVAFYVGSLGADDVRPDKNYVPNDDSQPASVVRTKSRRTSPLRTPG